MLNPPGLSGEPRRAPTITHTFKHHSEVTTVHISVVPFHGKPHWGGRGILPALKTFYIFYKKSTYIHSSYYIFKAQRRHLLIFIYLVRKV